MSDREQRINDCESQDDIALLLGESIAELRKQEMDIKKLESGMSWRRNHVKALKEDITLLRQRLGLSASNNEDSANDGPRFGPDWLNGDLATYQGGGGDDHVG